jgi:DNA-binding CsgD family transcriptional regulator
MSRVTGTDDRGLRSTLSLLLVSAVVVLVTVGSAQGLWLANLHNGLLALAFTGVGAYVVAQRAGDREGVLLLGTGVVEAVMFLGRQVGHAASPDVVRWWAWAGVWPVVLALALATFSVLCFPDGHLPSPRWRPVAVAVLAVAAVCATLSALWPVEYGSAGVTSTHPVHAHAPALVAALWSGLAHPAYVAFQLLWVVAVLARWRSSDGHVRRQLAWLVLAAGGSAAALVVGLLGWGTPRPGILSAAVLPLAAGWAIVHGQHRAAYAALTWLSRSGPGSDDLPGEFAGAVAQSLGASGATLWAGTGGSLHAVGVWPGTTDRVAPEELTALGGSPGRHVRAVTRGGEVIGALSVDRPRTGPLSVAQDRLLDDLGAQAALVLEHHSLSGGVTRRRPAALDGLTPREREVLELLARGLSNAAICAELHLSVKTVEPLVSTVFTKLGLQADAARNRRVLAALAYLRS